MSQDKKKTQITIDDVSYNFEDLTPEQQELFSHCVNLDQKIGSTQFQLVQLNVGKEAFIKKLKDSLERK